MSSSKCISVFVTILAVLIYCEGVFADQCEMVPYRNISSQQTIAIIAKVMRAVGTDCELVREVRLLDKSNRMMAIYAIRCEDGSGLQKEISVSKSTGRWMDTVDTRSAPSTHLVVDPVWSKN
jgi:hypothetical protein